MSKSRDSEHQTLINKDDPVVEVENNPTVQTKSGSPRGRRAEVDVIIIFLTYGIYLYHFCLLYLPEQGLTRTLQRYYVPTNIRLIYPNISSAMDSLSEDPYTIISPVYILATFIGFMDAWNMPMFFFLSGQNAYGALFRRSETQFRTERVHRLLVPSLFLFVVTHFFKTLQYFALQETQPKLTFLEYLQDNYKFFPPDQAWFLVYLFIYAQLFTHWFRAFHPAHNSSDSDSLTCCGSTVCCCTTKPFNCFTKIFCCLNFMFKPAQNPHEFVSAVKWFLGGPTRRALLPGVIIGVVQTAQNLIPYSKCMPLMFSQFMMFYPFFVYMIVFLLGYAAAATDIVHEKEENTLCSWINFISGSLLCIAQYPVSCILSNTISNYIVTGLMRGIGLWLFLIGSVAMAGKKFTAHKDWYETLRMMAMPFYLTHYQILTVIFTGASWVPYLRTFPVMLIITSFATISISYLITKSGPICYFFGLPTPQDSFLPGTQIGGYVPVIALTMLVVGVIILANLL